MARFDDSPALFGVGVGLSTCGDIVCQWCGKKYKDREDKNGEAFSSSTSICVDNFGGRQICDCCFEVVENAVLNKLHIILPWYLSILRTRKEELEREFRNLKDIRDVLDNIK